MSLCVRFTAPELDVTAAVEAVPPVHTHFQPSYAEKASKKLYLLWRSYASQPSRPERNPGIGQSQMFLELLPSLHLD